MERAALVGGKSHTVRRQSLLHSAETIWSKTAIQLDSFILRGTRPSICGQGDIFLTAFIWLQIILGALVNCLYTLTLTGWKLMEIYHNQMSGIVTESQ